MSQVTIYLDEQTEKLMKIAAQSSGISQSKWIAQIIREKAGGEWPSEIRALAGAWSDLPTAKDIRAFEGKDSPRDSL